MLVIIWSFDYVSITVAYDVGKVKPIISRMMHGEPIWLQQDINDIKIMELDSSCVDNCNINTEIDHLTIPCFVEISLFLLTSNVPLDLVVYIITIDALIMDV